MGLDFTGKLIKVMPELSGQSSKGGWRKQDFVLEDNSTQYPKKACFQAWGDKIDLVQTFQVGDEIKVHFNIESREYNDKWFTDLRIWKVEAGSESETTQSSFTKNNTSGKSKVPDFPDVDTFKSSGDDDGDLPF
jgi:hypothetical protein